MKFGAKVLVTRGGSFANQGEVGCRRTVKGVLVGAYKHMRIVRLTEDDRLSSIKEWSKAGDIGQWGSGSVKVAP